MPRATPTADHLPLRSEDGPAFRDLQTLAILSTFFVILSIAGSGYRIAEALPTEEEK